ncbi:MAG: hypothetical protein EON54_01315 [Alcaligenaceae bacterium]|nr:MAG: hypothetical protein EON54_01315 [Alcaligenaceae bacterium]
MADVNNDLVAGAFNSVNPNVAKVTSTRTAGGTTLACDNLAGWSTDLKVNFSTYKIGTDGVSIVGQIDWQGIVSGNSIGSLKRVAGATDDGNAINDWVELNPTAKWADEIARAILVAHNPNGSLKDGVVTTAKIADMNITTDKIADTSITTAKLAATSVSAEKLNSTNTLGIALRQNLATIDQGTPSTSNTLSNAVPNIKAALISGFVYKITYKTGSFDMGGTSNAELFIREDSNTGNVLSVDAATTPKNGQYGSLAGEAFYTATATGVKTFAFALQLSGTGVTRSSYTNAYVELIGKPGNGL